MERKIEEVYKESIKVVKDCSLSNGAIVASNILDESYPKDVKSYFYVWPRDASFVCYAADLVGLHEIPEKFFEWCWERAELFREKGVFLANKYYPHGRMAGDFDVEIKPNEIKNKKVREFAESQTITRLFYANFQPDQTASLIWAVYEHSKFRSIEKFKPMIEKAANSISNLWSKTCFKVPTYDLWEEKAALPKLNQVHTYSLAMCKKALECAVEILGPRKKWSKRIQQMKNVLEKCYLNGYFVKTYGKVVDKTIDSSSLGLVWPSESFNAEDPRIVSTVKMILQKNCIEGGIHRYPNDKYDGRISFCKLCLGGGGAWPVLNFWLSIYFCLAGKKQEAMKYFNWILERVEKKLPEQIKNGKPASIVPLAWSHAMFIIAGKFLELF
jgi:GH15 family glucan-1,4-alpha-glucosidase